MRSRVDTSDQCYYRLASIFPGLKSLGLVGTHAIVLMSDEELT